jgi:hypothetical protein
MIEIRFDKHMTIEDVKFKLHKHTGTPSCSQRLVLKDGGQVGVASRLRVLARKSAAALGWLVYAVVAFDCCAFCVGVYPPPPILDCALFVSPSLASILQPIANMDDDRKMLGYYSPESGMEIHIVDTDPFSMSRGGGLEDESQVEK